MLQHTDSLQMRYSYSTLKFAFAFKKSLSDINKKGNHIFMQLPFC
jgi:hypothetical protein